LRSRASRRLAEEEVAVVEEEAELAVEEEVALAAEEEVALTAAEEQAGVDSERLAQLFEQAGVVKVSEVSTTPLCVDFCVGAKSADFCIGAKSADFYLDENFVLDFLFIHHRFLICVGAKSADLSVCLLCFETFMLSKN
jgi:hypothetical protein